MSRPISFKQKHWRLPDESRPELVAQMARDLRLPPLVAQLLVNRGMASAAEAVAFLNPQFKLMHEPGLLPNMARATSRIVEAIKAGQQIVIFGDYDVDGITGTAMLWHVLKAAGAKVTHYIPHRVEEGYGLNTEAIAGIIDQGAELIVSVDCGGSAHGPVQCARNRGIDVIITDHHELPAELPEAYAIVHPRLPGSAYPNGDLCGAGVAFKLAWSVASALCGGGKVSDTFKRLLVEFSALVALGTIADVVPLAGENRIIARYGLSQLPRSGLTGVQALIAAAGYAEKKIDGTAVGFSLAPRLNAAGRMGHASLALELLTTATPERAQEIATFLEAQNRQRQATERAMVEVAKAEIAGWPVLPKVIVVCASSHHAGVVGIVASRLVDTFHRPTFVLSCDEVQAHGSARSIAGFDLHHAIDHCRPLLTSGGGHAMAGGLKLPLENLAAFRAAVNAYADPLLTEDLLMPQLQVDGLVRLDECDVPSLVHLAQFEPFGRGNPHPRFLLQRARIYALAKAVGATGDHLQLQLTQSGRITRAIAFKFGSLAAQLPVGLEVDLVVEPKIDEWNGSRRVDLQVIDLARSDGVAFGGLASDAA